MRDYSAVSVLRSDIIDDDRVGARWWSRVFKVTQQQPPRWLERGEMPPSVGRVAGVHAWMREDAERFLEILHEQTGIAPDRTRPAERRHAVQAFLGEREAAALEDA